MVKILNKLSEKRHFIVSKNNIINNSFILEGSEAHHAINVTRVLINEEIYLIDKKGCLYTAIIKKIYNSLVEGIIVDIEKNYNESRIKIELGISLLKGSKLDLVVEKCTELGVHSITPLITEHSILKKVNVNRLIKKAEVAIKQCGRGLLPEINEAIPLNDWFDKFSSKFIIVLDQNDSNNSLKKILSKNKIQDVILVIGPEGGFSKKELMNFKTRKVKFANLGTRRLKAETAAILSTGLIDHFVHEDIF